MCFSLERRSKNRATRTVKACVLGARVVESRIKFQSSRYISAGVPAHSQGTPIVGKTHNLILY